MAQPKNIDNFDRCVGVFFSQLYKAFPSRIDIRFADVPESLFEEDDSMDEVVRKFDGYAHAVRWLCDAGYVYVNFVDDRAAEGVVLSPKGLEAMRAKPKSLFQRASIGDRIVDAVKNGAKSALQDAVKLALTKGATIVGGQF